jgi:hypothetical protein
MKKILIIDDIRDCFTVFPHTEYDRDNALGFDLDDCIVIARTYTAAMQMLHSDIVWDCVFLDHDLGFNENNKSGYDWICELEHLVFVGGFKPVKDLICVSSNPAGKVKIEAAWKKIKGEIDNAK